MDLIHDAAEADDCVTLKRLLESDPSLISFRNGLDDEPLHTACMQKHLAASKLLVQFGADVNALGDYGRTPLHYAVHDSGLECLPLVEFLLESGGDPSLKFERWNVLEYARQEQYEGLEQTIALINKFA